MGVGKNCWPLAAGCLPKKDVSARRFDGLPASTIQDYTKNIEIGATGKAVGL
jgi:hypothetical protein